MLISHQKLNEDDDGSDPLWRKIDQKFAIKIGALVEYLSVIGPIGLGENECLSELDLDVMSHYPSGYKTASLPMQDHFEKLKAGLEYRIISILSTMGLKMRRQFTLGQLHNEITDQSILAELRRCLFLGFPVEELPIDFEIVREMVSSVCGDDVFASHDNARPAVWAVRFVRPGRISDVAPPHKDVWMPTYRGAVNVYLPICGSNENSSLPICPGSHLVNEARILRTAPGSNINGRDFPLQVALAVDGKLEMIRPQVMPGQALIFSPYAIHGHGTNQNTDVTRFSLEMRFWRRPINEHRQ